MSAPWTPDAERWLIGAALQSRPDREDALRLVMPEMLHLEKHRLIWEVIGKLHEEHEILGVDTVVEELRRAGLLEAAGGRQFLTDTVMSGPALTSISYLASILRDDYALRELENRVAKISELLRWKAPSGEQDLASRRGTVAGELWDEARELIEQARPVSGHDPPMPIRELLDLGLEPPPWLIPNVLRCQDRCYLVAAEGIGKTTLNHQLVVQVSQGLHPFRPRLIEPHRGLLVDLENNAALRVSQLDRMLRVARAEAPDRYDESRLFTKFPERSLDLTTRVDVLWLEEQIEVARPDIVSLGPVYKLHVGDGKESSVVRVLTDVIDRLRTTYGCAFLLEGHAPHESFRKGKDRAPLRPTGSRAWIYWADMVRTVDYDPTSDVRVLVDKARGDRERGRQWPEELMRGAPDAWPWMAP